MGRDGIFQFKGPGPVPDSGPAQIDLRLCTYMPDVLDAEYLFYIDSKHLMALVLQLKAQWTQFALRCADRDHIHWPHLLFHTPSPPNVFYIIAHSFDFSKWNFVVAW